MSVPKPILHTAIFLMISIQIVSVLTPVFAASSPWNQTDWHGGSGQTSFTDNTKYFSGSAIDAVTASGEFSLSKNEKLTNTGFESDLSNWNSAATSFADSTFNTASGAVAAWPLDDTISTQSFARVVNPAVNVGRDIVLNGSFLDSSVWNLPAEWSISGGIATANNASSGADKYMTQTAPIVAGKAYQVTYTILNRTQGGARILVGNSGTTTVRFANGTYTENVVAVGNTTLYVVANSGFVGSIDNVSVVQLNIPATPVVNATELLADGNMEAAGTGSWTPGGFATLSKQTTSPHGGSQVLRVANDGSHTSANANQSSLTAGVVYRATGYMRSDGTSTPRVLNNSSTAIVTGTSSTTWQPFDVVFVAAGTTINFQASLSLAGSGYAEFDDVSVMLDTSIRQDDPIIDGDMEAVGTSSWTPGPVSTLSKQSGSSHGGSQSLRVTSTGSGNSWAVQPGAIVTGKTYRIRGYYRGDGSSTYPTISLASSGTAIATGTSSNTWQAFDATAIADSSSGFLLRQINASNNYVEFDDVVTTEVNPLAGKPTNGVIIGSSTGSGGHLSNAYTFDGTNDFVNTYSTDLNSAFNPSEGTLVAWAKVTGSGVWTDGINRRILRLTYADSNNMIDFYRNGNNIIAAEYIAGGTTNNINISTSTTNWFQIALTWSKSNGQVKAYLNGNQSGSTLTGLGTWVGNIVNSNSVIGATNTSALLPWSGQINDVRLYNRALSASEISNLYSGIAATRDTSIKYAGTASAKLVAQDGYVGTYTQSVNVADTNNYNLVAYAYTNGSAVSASDLELYYNGAPVSTNFSSVGGGWYKLTGTVTGANAARDYGVQVKAGKTVYIDEMSLNDYTNGSMTSSIFDTGQGSNWGTLTYSATVPTNTSVALKVRTSNDPSMSGASAFTLCNAVSSGVDISNNNCVTDSHRYIQYQVSLSTTDTTVTPTFLDISIPFTVSDTTPPVITLTPLSPDPNNNSSPVFSGSAADAAGTIASVQYSVDTNSGSWSNCSANDGSFNSATEAFTCSTFSLSNGAHTIYIRSTDSNGNTTSLGQETTDQFTIDTIAPTTPGIPTTTSPTSNTRPTWSWTASSDITSGLATTPYTIEWSQSPSFLTTIQSSTSNTATFTHITPLTDGTWYIRVKAQDASGNVSSYSPIGTVSINTGAPTGSITINSNDLYTKSQTVTLQLSASSGFFASTSNIQMKISNNPDLSDGVYEAFKSTKSWTLTSGDGNKGVYVQFKDATNNESGAYSDSILLDTHAPTPVALVDPANRSYTNSEQPTFKWKPATESDTSGIASYALTVENGAQGDIHIDSIPASGSSSIDTLNYSVQYEHFDDADPNNNVIAVHLKPGYFWGQDQNNGRIKEGKRNWKVITTDNAGNQSTSETSFFDDRTAPDLTIEHVNDIQGTGLSYETTDTTPTFAGVITDRISNGDNDISEQSDQGPKVASGPKEIEIEIDKKNGNNGDLIGTYTIHVDTVRYTCDNSVVTDNANQKCDKYWNFSYTLPSPLEYGDYNLIFKSRDNANNTSTKTVSLRIGALDTIASPIEKTTIENELSNIPKKDQDTIKKDIEFTKPDLSPVPTLPNQVQTSVRDFSTKAGNYITGNALALISTITSGVKMVISGSVNSLSLFIQFNVSMSENAGKSIAISASEMQYHIATGYSSIANSTSGATKKTLLEAQQYMDTSSKSLASAVSGITMVSKNTVNTVQKNLSFAEKQSSLELSKISDSIGISIVNIGYLFIKEPTQIYAVKTTVLSSTSVKIVWETNTPASGKVNYGTDKTYTKETQTNTRTTHHEFILKDLKPDTTYKFEIMSQGKTYVYDANREFTTPK